MKVTGISDRYPADCQTVSGVHGLVYFPVLLDSNDIG